MEQPAPPLSPEVGFSHFAACDLRVATVIEVDELEGARRPAYVLQLDFGPLGVLKSTAQLTADYTPQSLLKRKVVAMVNLPPKQVGTHISRCLVLGGVHGEHVGLLSVPDSVPNGTRIH